MYALQLLLDLRLAVPNGADLKILPHGHALENPASFRDQRDAHARREMSGLSGDVTAIDDDLTALCLDHTNDGLERGGFPGAVSAEQRDDLASANGHAEIAHADDFAIADEQIVHFKLPGHDLSPPARTLRIRDSPSRPADPAAH